ncbi:cytochrome P450 [Vararia minispora EC-137]|uniref:Cytochrome P450 n=1 Tax=Vararia minispora EC-137 TaxID=1314806 RepID=A0ACB8QRX1_9AGAM|nr:cytochrome P450 [Vararia minispora EC-137]
MAISVLDVAFVGLALWLVKQTLSRKRSSLPLPPGPPGLPVVGNVADIPTTQPYKTYIEWGQKYGPLMHISALGQPLIIVNDVKIAIDLLDKKSALYSDRPTLRMAGELTGWDNTLVLQHYDERLKEYRRYIHRFLGTRSNLERFHPLFEHESRLMLKRIVESPEDFAGLIRHAAGAIIMKMTYGYSIRDDKDPFVSLVDQATTEFGDVTDARKVWFVDLIPALKYVPEWVPGATFQKVAKAYGQTLKDMADVPMNWVKQRMAAGEAESCFVTDLLEESGRTAQEERNIKWAAASLYSGGADTTVATLHTFFLCMTLFPDAQRKAQEEIDSVIGPDRLPTFADRHRLPYVEAVLSEVLRWGPVGPIDIPHLLMEDDVYNGYFIPKGSIVFANIWAMLHDANTYADPMEFKPERFIARPGKPAEQDPRACSFGFGRRACPGMTLAETTVWLWIATALATLNVSKARDADGVEITPSGRYLDGTIAHPEPFKCSIKPRSPATEALINYD